MEDDRRRQDAGRPDDAHSHQHLKLALAVLVGQVADEDLTRHHSVEGSAQDHPLPALAPEIPILVN